MQTAENLRQLLERIDRKGYPAYKDTKGAYQFQGYVLSIDHVQGDPFAAPSRVSVQIKGAAAAFPQNLYDRKWKKTALEDFLLRQFGRQVGRNSFQAKGSGKSGLMSVSRPGQEILERSACHVDERTGDLVMHMEVGFPANGRTVNSRELQKILFDYLPECVRKALYYKAYKPEILRGVAELAEDQQYIREYLKEQELLAFVADGAVLPRESGVSQKPLQGALPFQSPESLRVTLTLPHAGVLSGMAIPKGVIMITGGGYHGKSTLLNALERAVYPHIAGDGREYVALDESAMKIRAEDGRSIQMVDISLFIRNLPNGKDTVCFSTENASGSTSQAANVMEAIEAGSRVLLVDEDTSATNFMIRDELMQRVVHRDKEPIVPFIDRVRELYEQFGISTVLVAGSSGAYFGKSDVILQMDQYRPVDITEFARKEAEAYLVSQSKREKQETLPGAQLPAFERKLQPVRSLQNNPRLKIKTSGRDTILLDHEAVDMRYVEQLVDEEQLSALGHLLKTMAADLADGRHTLRQIVTAVEKQLDADGFEKLSGGKHAFLARPRRQEIFAVLNRYRQLQVK